MFYLAAPVAVSERVTDADRGFWFTRFGAFQMAGIGGGPVLALALVNSVGFSTSTTFKWLALACVLAGVFLWMFESLTPRPARTNSGNGVKPANWVRSLVPLTSTLAIYPILMVGLGACVFTGMLTFQSSLVRVHGLDPSLYFTVYAAIVALARFTLVPAINKGDSNRTAIILLVLMAAGVFTYFGICYGVTVQVASAILLGLG